jgi:hypothetical protein
MSSELMKADPSAIKALIMGGDLARLDDNGKLSYYRAVCDSLGLNPLTQPFSYLKLNGKEILYANRSCTEQLRKINAVSVASLDGRFASDLYIVTCSVRAQDRTDVSTGAVSVKGLVGDALANAIMKAETKAKRRATLSICGLGLLDESEVETIPDAQPVRPTEQPKAIAHHQEQEPKRDALKMTAANLKLIKAEAVKHGCDTGKILAYYEVTRSADLSAAVFDDCMGKIQARHEAFLSDANFPQPALTKEQLVATAKAEMLAKGRTEQQILDAPGAYHVARWEDLSEQQINTIRAKLSISPQQQDRTPASAELIEEIRYVIDLGGLVDDDVKQAAARLNFVMPRELEKLSDGQARLLLAELEKMVPVE